MSVVVINMNLGPSALGPFRNEEQAIDLWGSPSENEEIVEVMTPEFDRWEIDAIQFPRLLAEIRAVGLTEEQYKVLSESMDLPGKERIDELLERAETEWQALKEKQRQEEAEPG